MILINEEICCYCGSCVAVCPQNIIELIDTYLRIDQQKCINCGICVKGCPMGVLTLKGKGVDGLLNLPAFGAGGSEISPTISASKTILTPLSSQSFA
ncbi:TPA: 4Fe-4S dicluster domain-containing protein [Candidatus Poribacteria bacterium]|nr:4Fe-4S dicluster domain-containing protein [Candidatus Poribacteria bacterium]